MVRSCICVYYRLDWFKVIFTCQRSESRFNCAAKAYMLLLVGFTIFADKTFTRVKAKYLSLFRVVSRCGGYYWGQLHLSHSTYI